MQTTKMSLANIQGKLSRAEMKNIMAGSGEGVHCECNNDKFAGMVSCYSCERYCSIDHNYGGERSCS